MIRISKLLTASLLAVLSAHTSTVAQRSGLTIGQARQILAGKDQSTKTLGTISLQGLDYSREIEMGQGFRVIVLSRHMGGGLLAFSPEGSLENSIATDEITWFQLIDLSNDQASQLVTEEVIGRGTGITVKEFRLYAIDKVGIRLVWNRLSYRAESLWNAGSSAHQVKETQCFLRFDEAGAGMPRRMTYLELLPSGVDYKKTVFEISGATIREITSQTGEINRQH